MDSALFILTCLPSANREHFLNIDLDVYEYYICKMGVISLHIENLGGGGAWKKLQSIGGLGAGKCS